ncbi:MAG: hypothetical protein CME70_07005 [Halobacteriovorax sp.]|nr:hypothetical protein [Halobacteriovorax sp.]
MQKNKIILLFLLLFTLLQLGSCQKQSAPEVRPEESWEIRDQERLEACSKVNFTQDLLLHQNTFFLFKCTGWDKTFPSLNRGIQNINPASWNHFFRPIDNAFLNDRQRRDRIFDHIRDLDSKRGLDDLSRVLTALNETNFYDGMRDMFLCAEDRTHKNCEKRRGRELSKEQLKNLVKLVDLKPVAIKALSLLIKESMTSLGENAEPFREEVRKFFYGEDFINVRLRLVSSLAQKFYYGLSPLEKEFYKKIPVVSWKDSKEPYLYTWIQKPTFTNAVFRRLTSYAVTENPDVLKDIKLLKRGYHYPLYCKPYSDSARIDIDLKTHVDEFLNFVYENEYEPFHDYIVQNVASLQLAISFCPKLKNYSGDIAYVENGRINRGNHSLNFVELEKKLVDLTSEIPIFDISKFVTFLASRNLGDIPPNPGFLLDIATEEAVEWIVEMCRIIHKSSDSYFDIAFQLLKNTKPLAFNSVGVLVNEFLLAENDEKIKALAASWLFLDQEEQNFLFNFIDRHLQQDTNFKLLFNFYATMLEEYAVVSPEFSELWTSTPDALENSYQAMFDIVKNFSGANVLKDFDKFFSRDHIITIMKVVTRGPDLRRVALNRLSANLITDYVTKLPYEPYEIDFTNGETEYSRKTKVCIDSLTDNKDLYFILNNFPKECLFFKDKEITLQTFSWLAESQNRYEEMFNISPRSSGTLLDNDGLMASSSLNNAVAMLRLVDEKLAFRINQEKSGGLKYILDLGHKYLYQVMVEGRKGYLEDLDRLTSVVSAYFSVGGANHRYLRNTKLFESIVDEGPKIEVVSNWFATVFKKYNEKLSSGSLGTKEYVEDVAYSCENYVNQDIGAIPCPSTGRVKKALTSVIKDATVVYEKNGSSTVGYFLQALVPGYGLSIPFKSKNQRLKRITVSESAQMVYKLSDKKLPINKLKIKFNEDDEYDRGYNVDNWSGLKWRKSKNELADLDELEETINPETELFFKDDMVEVTTLDRVEISIRDVRFDMSYLGAHYMNAVAKAEDYNETVEKKLKMFKTCTGARFCGKFFNKQQIRMAKNAVAAYPGLLDANRVKEFGFGDYMQALLGTFIRSSSNKAQKSALVKIKIFGKRIEVPWVQTKKQLRKHNGKILTKISMLSGISNFSRFVRDRVGRTDKEFQGNINDPRVKLLDTALFTGINPITLEKEAIALLSSLIEQKNGKTLLGEAIDWMAKSSYQEQRELESLIFDLAVISSFIGIGPVKADYELSDKNYDRYRNNNLGSLISVGSVVLPKFINFVDSWPAGLNFIDIIRGLQKPVRFIADELVESKKLDTNLVYKLLNEAFFGFNKFFNEATENSENGAYYISEYLSLEKEPKKVLLSLKAAINLIEELEKKDSTGNTGFSILSQNLTKVVGDRRFGLRAFSEYLLKTTHYKNCRTSNELDCDINIHHDEPAQLVMYFSSKNGSNSTNIVRFIDTLFKDNINDYTEMIDNLLPLIRIKSQ